MSIDVAVDPEMSMEIVGLFDRYHSAVDPWMAVWGAAGSINGDEATLRRIRIGSTSIYDIDARYLVAFVPSSGSGSTVPGMPIRCEFNIPARSMFFNSLIGQVSLDHPPIPTLRFILASILDRARLPWSFAKLGSTVPRITTIRRYFDIATGSTMPRVPIRCDFDHRACDFLGLAPPATPASVDISMSIGVFYLSVPLPTTRDSSAIRLGMGLARNVLITPTTASAIDPNAIPSCLDVIRIRGLGSGSHLRLQTITACDSSAVWLCLRTTVHLLIAIPRAPVDHVRMRIRISSRRDLVVKGSVRSTGV